MLSKGRNINLKPILESRKLLNKNPTKERVVSPPPAKVCAHPLHRQHPKRQGQGLLNLTGYVLLNSRVKVVSDPARIQDTGLLVYMDSGHGMRTD